MAFHSYDQHNHDHAKELSMTRLMKTLVLTVLFGGLAALPATPQPPEGKRPGFRDGDGVVCE
jgi:hypothetical protein